jgi:hypothetical protein
VEEQDETALLGEAALVHQILRDRGVASACVFLSELLSLPRVEMMQELLLDKLAPLLPPGECTPTPILAPIEDSPDEARERTDMYLEAGGAFDSKTQ